MRNRARLGLKKPRFRQSWNKYNLYAFSRLVVPGYKSRTFFQQKWTAKSVLRMYHSEQVGERYWEKMFNSRLKAVVPMDPAYLARNDGSIESAGRGSGLDKASKTKKTQRIPWMATTFAPLERRLDTAVFRSLFASSARQARQFVVHGSVRVNGKLMRHPGYLLNPGDMFQVDPDMVMFATGAMKEIEGSSSSKRSSPKSTEAGDTAEGEKDATATEEPAPEEEAKASPEPAEDDLEDENPHEVLKSLLGQAKFILSKSQNPDLSARRKVALRGFSAQVKRQLSRSKSSSTILTDSLEAQFAELKAQLTGKAILPGQEKPATTASTDSKTDSSSGSPTSKTSEASQDPEAQRAANEAAATELMTIHDALALLRDNPIDSSKPYATPWQPKPYMSAFTFVPRYLEVNQNICAAVYLRHPVARPGMSEVPSPFPEATQGEAYIWYLRRR